MLYDLNASNPPGRVAWLRQELFLDYLIRGWGCCQVKSEKPDRRDRLLKVGRLSKLHHAKGGVSRCSDYEPHLYYTRFILITQVGIGH